MAFNRIIRGLGWPDASQGEIDFPADRVPDNASDLGLALLPTLFMAEGRERDDLARVGSMLVAGRSNTIVRLRYQYDPSVPIITQDRVESVATEIGLSGQGTGSNRFDWTHTRWSVQDGDLYRTILRLVDEWVTAIGLRPEEYGTHSLRRTKASMIYKATGNIRAIQILLGHSKIENTVRYLGVDVEDALLLAERTEI